MTAKPRKTTIHTETTVVTLTETFWNPARQAMDKQTRTYARFHLFTLCGDIAYKVSKNGVPFPGTWEEDAPGFRDSLFETFEIGDTIAITAYRIHEFYDNATLVGTATGTFTLVGLVFDAYENVTPNGKCEQKAVRKYVQTGSARYHELLAATSGAAEASHASA